MGFWGNLGKGLLKVGKIAAPIALGATGVGLPAAMAVSGGLNALDKKVSGGSWKDALLAGGIGAGSAYGADKLSGFMGKLGGAMKNAQAGRTPGFAGGYPGIQSGVPAGLENVGRVALPNMGRGVGPSMGGFAGLMQKIGQGARTTQDVMGAVNAVRGPQMPQYGPGGMMPRGGGPMGFGSVRRNQAMQRMDQSNPNLAYPIMRGRQEAIMNQPFRMGAQVGTQPEGTTDPASIRYSQLPPIYPNIPDRDVWNPGGRGIGPSYIPY